MEQEDWSHKLPACKEYLAVTDERRGTSFENTFPPPRVIKFAILDIILYAHCRIYVEIWNRFVKN